MDEYAEKMVNDLRKIANIYAKIAGDLVREIEWIEDELLSGDSIDYYGKYIESQYYYRKNVMMKITNPEETWNHEKEVWEELIDFYTPKEEES